MKGQRLFRKEVSDHLRNRWLGKALLVSGFPLRYVVLLTTLFAIFFLVFIISGQYTRRINVSGEIISLPHAIDIFSPQQGFITEQRASAGQIVKKGEHLYQIDVSRFTRTGSVSENSIAAINHQISQIDNIIVRLKSNRQTTLDTLNNQLDQYRTALQKSQDLLTSAAEGMSVMRTSMENYSRYQNQGLVTRDQLSNQRYLFYQQQNAFQSLSNQVIQEEIEITRMQSELSTRAADFDNQISQYEYQRSDLNRQLTEAAASGTLFINAPVDGKLETVSITPGQMVNPGDSLAQLIPADSHTYLLRLWLPNSSLPYIKPGDPVNIRYEAFPFEKFGQFAGRIVSVSSVPASAQEIARSRGVPSSQAGTEPYYKVLVEPEQTELWHQGKNIRLMSGMKAQTTLFLEQRAIYQWMVSPVYDIRKSVSGPIYE